MRLSTENSSRTVRRPSTFSTCGAAVAKPARRRAAKIAMPLPSPGWAMQQRALGLTSWCHAPLCGRRLFCWCVRAMIVTGRHSAVRGNDRVCSACCKNLCLQTVRSLPSAPASVTAIGEAHAARSPPSAHVLASRLSSARPVAVQIVTPDLGSWQAPRMPSDAGATRLRTCHTDSC